VDGLDVAEAPRVLEGYRRAMGRPDAAVGHGWQYLQNAGRPAEATALLRERGSPAAILLQLIAALYMNGDSALAGEAAGRLEGALGSPARDTLQRQGQYWGACTLARWYVALGQWERAARVRSRAQGYLTGADRAGPTPPALCWLAVDALMAEAQGRGEWRDMVRRLDSLSATGGMFGIGAPSPVTPTLDLARLLERAGDIEGALRAVRRFPYHQQTTLSLATHLREEGRLAALAGDTAAAIQAYGHYLALRPDPEPSVAPEVERVRQELERLTARQR